jgi:hypothetical protein
MSDPTQAGDVPSEWALHLFQHLVELIDLLLFDQSVELWTLGGQASGSEVTMLVHLEQL